MAEAFEMKEGTPFNPKVLVTNTVGNVITRYLFQWYTVRLKEAQPARAPS